jgi:uncharacterized repeat protein (TIGR03803 family)
MSNFNWGMRACGIFLLWGTAAIVLPGQTFTTLHSFDYADGSSPLGALVQGTDGKFYGTTSMDGAYGNYGTVFSITVGGDLTVLLSFRGFNGYNSAAGLVQGTNGNFYGTTAYGGTSQAGTIFSVAPRGGLIMHHDFCSPSNIECPDMGAYPFGRLVQAADGRFYGTTSVGGAKTSCPGPEGCGTVFSITPGAKETLLYSFDDTDGQFPYGGLVQGTNGTFYGTTYEGGANGEGTVFSITAKGALTTLHSFDGSDGQWPQATLVWGADGNLYGTTAQGGPYGGGTVFKITPDGTLTTLHSFCSEGSCVSIGSYPVGGVILGTDGILYGTTRAGGTGIGCGGYGCGTIFRITPNGGLTTLYNFNLTADGEFPSAPLAQGTDGKFYGTTYAGGADNGGTVFSLSVGLGPFVETNPQAGKLGTTVNTLGTNLTGATSITFNGTAATFTVKSKSEITTTVPTGATTGTVQVETPGGTLLSNVPFRVK